MKRNLIISHTGELPSDTSPVELPLSKSIALRVLTLNGVCRAQDVNTAIIPRLPDSEDVEGMLRAINCFDNQLQNGSDFAEKNVVYIGEGGAPMRFFTALAASTPGIDMTISTSRGLSKRPLNILLDALRISGADISSLRKRNCPPFRIVGVELGAEELMLNPGISSQFISALMMTSPLWQTGLKIRFDGHKPVSMPYIEMTRRIMDRFCVSPEIEESENGSMKIHIPRKKCNAPSSFKIEPDWSAASYFYELAVLLPGKEIFLADLTPANESLQGDARCEKIFEFIGVKTLRKVSGEVALYCEPAALTAFIAEDKILELDMNDTPDIVPALTVAFCLAGVKFRFTSVGHLRHKETDRLAALSAEMEKLGYKIEIAGETLYWLGEKCDKEGKIRISTYSDHRMAMAFAPAAVKFPGLTIENPKVVGKSFPRYWEMLKRLGFEFTDKE